MFVRVALPSDLLDLVGTTVGPTEPLLVTASSVADYAASSGDRTGSFAALSLLNHFLPDLISVESFSAGINVGLDGASFGEPIRAGDLVRGTATVLDAAPAGDGVQIVIEVTLTAEGRDEPCCVARTVSRFFP